MAGNFLVFLCWGRPSSRWCWGSEQFKVQLETRHQTFTRLEGWQIGSDDEGVPILAQQAADQRSQFFIPTPVRIVGDICIGCSDGQFLYHIELIDPALRG